MRSWAFGYHNEGCESWLGGIPPWGEGDGTPGAPEKGWPGPVAF